MVIHNAKHKAIQKIRRNKNKKEEGIRRNKKELNLKEVPHPEQL